MRWHLFFLPPNRLTFSQKLSFRKLNKEQQFPFASTLDHFMARTLLKPPVIMKCLLRWKSFFFFFIFLFLHYLIVTASIIVFWTHIYKRHLSFLFYSSQWALPVNAIVKIYKLVSSEITASQDSSSEVPCFRFRNGFPYYYPFFNHIFAVNYSLHQSINVITL